MRGPPSSAAFLPGIERGLERIQEASVRRPGRGSRSLVSVLTPFSLGPVYRLDSGLIQVLVAAHGFEPSKGKGHHFAPNPYPARSNDSRPKGVRAGTPGLCDVGDAGKNQLR